jgi:hypothetical protein
VHATHCCKRTHARACGARVVQCNRHVSGSVDRNSAWDRISNPTFFIHDIKERLELIIFALNHNVPPRPQPLAAGLGCGRSQPNAHVRQPRTTATTGWRRTDGETVRLYILYKATLYHTNPRYQPSTHRILWYKATLCILYCVFTYHGGSSLSTLYHINPNYQPSSHRIV